MTRPRSGHAWCPKRPDGGAGTLGRDLKSNPPSTGRAQARSPVALPTNVKTTQGRTGARWVGILLTAWEERRAHLLALADQAVVSGTSFVTTVVIGRWTFPSELGIYSVGISLLVSALVVQESLITLPYTIRRHRPLGTQAEHAGSSLMICGLLSALGVVVVAATALDLSSHEVEPKLVAMTWALAAAMPFALLRDFGRRFAFAHLQIARALTLDVAVAVIQLATLSWLGWIGWMSAAAACAALGAACAASALAWLYLARADFAIRADHVWTTMQQSWGLGKWLFASQSISMVQAYVAYWLLAGIAGTAATGVYAACMSIALFANPLITGLGNILAPRAALAFKEGGGARLRREVTRDSLVLLAAMILFCAVVLFAGDAMMSLLYRGKEYQGNGHTITVLALSLLASAVGLPACNALGCIERPRDAFWIGVLAAAVTVALTWRLLVEWELLGAAYGLLAGNVAAAVGQWVAFLAHVPRDGPEPNPRTLPETSPRAIGLDSISPWAEATDSIRSAMQSGRPNQ